GGKLHSDLVPLEFERNLRHIRCGNVSRQTTQKAENSSSRLAAAKTASAERTETVTINRATLAITCIPLPNKAPPRLCNGREVFSCEVLPYTLICAAISDGGSND